MFYSNFFPTIIFEKSVQLVGCVWPYAKGRTQFCVLGFSSCESSHCDKKVEEDDQQTEMMVIPATFTKHLVTITASMTKRNAPHKAKRERMHTISHGNGMFTIASCNLQLFLFFETPIKELALLVSESDSRISTRLYSIRR